MIQDAGCAACSSILSPEPVTFLVRQATPVIGGVAADNPLSRYILGAPPNPESDEGTSRQQNNRKSLPQILSPLGAEGLLPYAMASVFNALPLLGRAASQLPRNFFTCQAHGIFAPRQLSNIARQALRLNAARPQSSRFFSQNSRVLSDAGASTLRAPNARLGPVYDKLGTLTAEEEPLKKTPKYVAYWLLGSAASVFGIVVFGGLTRLTESGYVV